MNKNRIWPLLVILGSIPGVIIWLFIVKLGYAGEFAGLVIGFGAFVLYRYFDCDLKISRLILGSLILIIIDLITNHLAYALDVYSQFAENWYEAAGESYSYMSAVKTVFNSFVRENIENMRLYYFEAAIQGMLTTLVMWIAFFIYYIKSDEIDREYEERKAKRLAEEQNHEEDEDVR